MRKARKSIYLWLALAAGTQWACGSHEVKKLTGKGEENEYESSCIHEVPSDVEEQNCDLDAAAHKARMAVVESERDRLEASPLQLSQLINVNRKSDDGEDPYPEAVPIHLDDLSKANDSPDLYAQFHGFDGARTVYETKFGSK
jgi:hypothetical protein